MNKVFKHKRGSNGLKVVCEFAKSHCGGGVKSVVRDGVARVASYTLKHMSLALIMAMSVNSIVLTKAQAADQGWNGGVISNNSADKAIAGGQGAYAKGSQDTAYGSGTKAVGGQSTAIGNDVAAAGNSSVAIGDDDIEKYYNTNILTVEDLKNQKVVEALDKMCNIGNNGINCKEKYGIQKVGSEYVVVSGKEDNFKKYFPTLAGGDGSIAIGARAVAVDQGNLAIGALATAIGKESAAIGSLSKATGTNSIAFGAFSVASDGQSIAVGNGAKSTEAQAAAFGSDIIAGGYGSITIGGDDVSPNGNGIYSTISILTQEDLNKDSVKKAIKKAYVNEPNKLETSYGIKIGTDDKITITNPSQFAKYFPSLTAGLGSIVIGARSASLGDGSVALGTLSKASGKQSTSLGTLSKAEGENSFALGANSLATQTNSMAFGVNSSSTMQNSIAIGYGSKTDYTGSSEKPYMPGNGYAMPMADSVGVVSVGANGEPRRIVNVAAGALDTDAVNVSQLKALVDNLGLEKVGSGEDTTLRYLSVEKTKGDAKDITAAIKKQSDFRNYVQLRKFKDIMEVRIKKSGNDKLYGDKNDPNSAIGKLMADIQKLETSYSNFKTTVVSADISSINKDTTENNVNSKITEIEKYTDTYKDTFKADLKNNAANDGATGNDAIAFGYAAKASGTNAVAIGKGADAKGENSITIGTGNTLGNDVTLGKSTLIGESNNISGDVGNQSVIIGSFNSVKATTGNKSGQNVIIGNDLSVSNSVGGIAIGGDDMGDTTYDKTTISGNGAIAIGANTQALKEKATAIGARSKVEVAGGVALGFESVMDRVTNNSDKGAFTGKTTNTVGAVSVGASSKERQVINLADGKADTDAVNVRQIKKILGDNVKYNADGTIQNIGDTGATNINDAIAAAAASSGTTIEYFSADGVGGFEENKNNDGINKDGKGNINIGANNKYTKGSYATMLGNQNTFNADTTTLSTSTIIGAHNFLSGYKGVGSGGSAGLVNSTLDHSMVIGDNNSIRGNDADTRNITKTDIIGHDNKIYSNTNSAVIIGEENKINENQTSQTAEKIIVIGKENKLEGASGSVAIGNIVNISANNAVAIGASSSVSVEGGVALGLNSSTNTDKGIKGFDFSTNKTSVKDDKVWKSTLAAVSIGNDTNTRQIVNLAAGTKDTDAVNVAQLKTVGLDFSGDSGNKFTRTQTNREVKIIGGAKENDKLTQNNIGVVSDGNGTLNIKLSKILSDLTSATFVDPNDPNNTTKLQDGSLSISNGPTVSREGINMGGKKITNTQAGDMNTDTDVATISNLKSIGIKFDGDNSKAFKATNDNLVKVIGGADVNKVTDNNNIAVISDSDKKQLAIKLARNLDLGADGSLTINKIKIDGATNKITNLSNGKDDSDAATVGQIDSKINDAINSGKVVKEIIQGENVTVANDKGVVTISAKDTNTVTSVTSKDSSKITVNNTSSDATKPNYEIALTDTFANSLMQGLKVEANSASDTINKDDTLKFAAGNNLKVELKDKTVTYSLSDEINFDDIQVGKPGENGQPGKDGTIGVNGKDGKNAVTINGKDGIIGLTGATGKDGKDGKDAMTNIGVKDGKPGVNGKDGENITRIVYTDPKDPDNQKVVATLDDGLKFAGNDGSDTNKIIKKKLNEQLDIIGAYNGTDYSANNIYVKNDNGKLLINFANKPTFSGGVKLGNIDMTPSGTTLKLTDGTVLTGLGTAQNDSDAVNLKMLKDQIAGLAVGTQSIVNANSPVSYVYDKDNGSGGKTPTIISRYIGNNGDVEYYDPKDIDPSTGKPKTNASKLDVKPNQVYISVLDPDKLQPGTATRFTNLADGTNDGDAINYKQFKNAGWTIGDKAEQTNDDTKKVNTNERVNFVSGDNNKALSVTLEKSEADTNANKLETYNVKFTPNFATITSPTTTNNQYTVGNSDGDKFVNATTVTKIANEIDGKIKPISVFADNEKTTGKDLNLGDKFELLGDSDTIKTEISQTVSGTDKKTTIKFALNKDKIQGLTEVQVGEKDEAGKPGKDGTIGVNGKDGSAVVINGKDGSIGAKGKDGKDGVTINGKDGTIGLAGAKGKDGKDAMTNIGVKDGEKGLDGADGTTMTRIVYEDPDGNNHTVATLDDGLKFGGNTGTPVAKKLNSQFDIKGIDTNFDWAKFDGGKNIMTQVDNTGVLRIALAKELTDITKITLKDASGADSVEISGTNGIDMKGKELYGLKSVIDEKGGIDKLSDEDKKKVATVGDLSKLNTTLQDVKNAKFEVGANAGNPKKIGNDDRINIIGKKGVDSAKWNTYDNGENIMTKINDEGDLVIALSKDIKFDDINVGEKDEAGKPGKDGTIGVNGKDGSAVVINGKDGSIGAKGKDGKDGVTINGEGHTISAKDENGNDAVVINGKDGTIGVNGKDGAKANIGVKKSDDHGLDGTITTRIVYKDEKGQEKQVTTLDDGIKFSGNNKGVNSLKLNKELKIIGADGNTDKWEDFDAGTNIATSAKNEGDDGKVTIALAKNLRDLESITLGVDKTERFIINNNGFKFIDANGNDNIKAPSITKDGINAGGNTITNVGDAKNDTDAVNKGQVIKMITGGVAGSVLTFKGDEGETKAKDNALTLVGGADTTKLIDNNIGVVKGKDGELNIKLTQNLDLGDKGSIKAGGVTIQNNTISGLTSVLDYKAKLSDELAKIDNDSTKTAKQKDQDKQAEIKKYKDALNKAQDNSPSSSATIGDLANLGNSIINNVIGDLGDLNGGNIDPKDPDSGVSKNNIKTYNPYGDTMKNNQTIVDAIKNINEGGIKYIHVSDDDKKGVNDSRSSKDDSQANKKGSIGIGMNAKSDGLNAIAIGTDSSANAQNTIAIGTGNIVNGENSGVIGDPSIINATNSYSVGNHNLIGAEKNADGTFKKLDNVFVLGNDVKISVSQALALGSNTGVEKAGGVALGYGSKSTRINSDAKDVYGGSKNTILGVSDENVEKTVAGALGVVSVGSEGNTRQITNVAAGEKDSDAVNVAQLKALASVVKSGSVANWMSINMSKDENGKPIAKPAKTDGENSVAIGNGAVTTNKAQNSVAIGNNSVANRPNTVSVGSEGKERTISNVAPGVLGTDAVNMNQLNALADYAKDTREQAFAGTAAAMAIGNLPQATIPGKSFMTLGGGYYKGESAMALGISRISDNGKWIVKGSTSMDSQDNFGAALSVGFHF